MNCLIVEISKISAFSIVLCLILLHLMEIFPITHSFWEKKIVNHCLTVVKQFETEINTEFATVNHCLINCKTRN